MRSCPGTVSEVELLTSAPWWLLNVGFSNSFYKEIQGVSWDIEKKKAVNGRLTRLFAHAEGILDSLGDGHPLRPHSMPVASRVQQEDAPEQYLSRSEAIGLISAKATYDQRRLVKFNASWVEKRAHWVRHIDYMGHSSRLLPRPLV